MSFDLVVVGAGHAGCEAAAAAARLGLEVCLVSLSSRSVAEMPCNPAVGGVGKGHLVVELDALGGLQGRLADRAGIQFRTLNSSRGPAVWGPRAQCDKGLYSRLMAELLDRHEGVVVVEAEVEGLVVGDRRVEGVRLRGGGRIEARAVVLGTGTFLDGILHVGQERTPGGRIGERPSRGLGEELRRLGLELRRFKTGTPPRLERDSIDFGRLERQSGDPCPRPFSWRSQRVENRVCCWVARTPPSVQRIILDNLERSPLFNGGIDGVGPRYCPSIEDKVVRFPHHREHTLFIEPEGLDSTSIYVNGLSTSLPADVQERVVRAVPGLEAARLLRFGYAVEYDVVAPTQVDATLEVRSIPGLYLAGQLLGTSGYEEAAVLGFLAGVNAALSLRESGRLVIGREEGYVGVLADDLSGRAHREPYRMFTSRAEHRLVLGVDSARERLMGHGVELGLVPGEVFDRERRRWERREQVRQALSEVPLNPSVSTRAEVQRLTGVDLRGPSTWARVLCRHDVDAEAAAGQIPILAELPDEDRRAVVFGLRYRGYVDRQRRQIERLARLRQLEIPEHLELESIAGLSHEVVDVLRHYRPRTLAEAQGLPGMTPAATAILAGRLAAPSPREERSHGEGQR